MQAIRVDLPEPEGPITSDTSPCSARKSTRFSTSTLERPLLKVFTNPFASSAMRLIAAGPPAGSS